MSKPLTVTSIWFWLMWKSCGCTDLRRKKVRKKGQIQFSRTRSRSAYSWGVIISFLSWKNPRSKNFSFALFRGGFLYIFILYLFNIFKKDWYSHTKIICKWQSTLIKYTFIGTYTTNSNKIHAKLYRKKVVILRPQQEVFQNLLQPCLDPLQFDFDHYC